MADIFSIQPPQWLTELVTMDTARPGREAFALGLAARKQQDESKLLGLRVQAQMLASQARIQQLENANASAAMHIQIQEGQIKLAAEKFKQAQTAAALKVSDTSDFIKRVSALPQEARSTIAFMNPSLMETGATPQQWGALQDAEKEQMKALNLVPAVAKLGDMTYKPPEEIGSKSSNAFTYLQKQRELALARGDQQVADELQGRISKLSGTDDEAHGRNVLQSILSSKIKGIDKELMQPENSLDKAQKQFALGNRSALDRRKSLLFDRMEADTQLQGLLTSPKPSAVAPVATSVPTPTGSPQPGEVRAGYRFTGGNPASQDSWEPAQDAALPGE